MKKSGPTKQEVRDAVNQIKGRFMINFEDSYTVAEYMVSQEAFKKEGAQNPQKVIAKLEKVTPADVKRVAEDILKKNQLSLTLVGALKDKKRFEKLLTSHSF